MNKMKNSNLNTAKKDKNNEFYTQLADIEKELTRYKNHFKDKVVYLNCDDPQESEFWQYFSINFNYLGLKKLISTHYDAEKPTYKLEMTKMSGLVPDPKKDFIKTLLRQNGDFRSKESIELLIEADIVVTNPPFSLFREYIAQLMSYNKKFLIIGNMNAITYKEVFPLIKDNKIWAGINFNKTMIFGIPEGYKWDGKTYDIKGRKAGKVPAITWYTNLLHSKRNEELILYKTYYGHEQFYPKYDNYDAIEVSKIKDIPLDYNGVMGVSISFLDKYNPNQFEILGNEYSLGIPKGRVYINGKRKYARILIRKK